MYYSLIRIRSTPCFSLSPRRIIIAAPFFCVASFVLLLSFVYVLLSFLGGMTEAQLMAEKRRQMREEKLRAFESAKKVLFDSSSFSFLSSSFFILFPFHHSPPLLPLFLCGLLLFPLLSFSSFSSSL